MDTPILPKEGMMVRHYVCGRCAVANRPSKHDAGITLHIIWYKRFDKKENKVYFLQACCLCDIEATDEQGKVLIKKQWIGTMLVTDWNALCERFPEDDDGY